MSRRFPPTAPRHTAQPSDLSRTPIPVDAQRTPAERHAVSCYKTGFLVGAICASLGWFGLALAIPTVLPAIFNALQ